MAQAGANDGGMTVGRMLLSPKGRIPRFDALFAYACLCVMFAAAAFVWGGWVFAYYRRDPAAALQVMPWTPLGGLGLLAGWMGFCILAKRCHDRDHSAWFLLMGLIPLANLWLLVDLFFWRGTRAVNRFGPEPEGMASQWRAANEDR